MSRARLVITAVTKQGLSQAEVARTYGVSEATVSRLMARYRAEGEAAFEPQSRRPKTTPGATQPQTVDLVLRLREQLLQAGHDAGARDHLLASDPAPRDHPVASHGPPD